MIMAGASFGGFLANWVQGHNERMGFKAIVCHDGGSALDLIPQTPSTLADLVPNITVFSTSNVWYTTEEIYFPEREFGGKPWEVPENYSRWNPQNHIHKWKTPQLIIRECISPSAWWSCSRRREGGLTLSAPSRWRSRLPLGRGRGDRSLQHVGFLDLFVRSPARSLMLHFISQPPTSRRSLALRLLRKREPLGK